MALVVFFLAFNAILVASYLHLHWTRGRTPGSPVLPRRLSAAHLYSFGTRQLLLAAMLAFTFWRGDWTLASVGVSSKTHWLDSILAGEIGFLVLMLVYTLLVWLVRLMPLMRMAAVRGNLRLWPRKRAHKVLACLFIMVFNPFTEELVMRGILIHQWGLILGSAAIPIIVGFVLNALLHGYQGWRMQLWHALFFILAVYLLYSPWGLVAAITAHVFGDVMPFVGLRRNLLRARKEQRRARASRATQTA